MCVCLQIIVVMKLLKISMPRVSFFLLVVNLPFLCLSFQPMWLRFILCHYRVFCILWKTGRQINRECFESVFEVSFTVSADTQCRDVCFFLNPFPCFRTWRSSVHLFSILWSLLWCLSYTGEKEQGSGWKHNGTEQRTEFKGMCAKFESQRLYFKKIGSNPYM